MTVLETESDDCGVFTAMAIGVESNASHPTSNEAKSVELEVSALVSASGSGRAAGAGQRQWKYNGKRAGSCAGHASYG